MTETLTFNHRPVPWRPGPGEPVECRVCGSLPDPHDPSRHLGEILPPLAVVPDDSSTLEELVRILRAELADTPVFLTDSQLDLLARRAADALYRRGAIKVRRSDWRPPGRAA
ncbi:hypothetical protein GCM10010156_77950 [Planobispora rosea]|uniref:Uncharacterized protein n=1 Tax=Planobispora rosea TaxID=35762 RepID=A0A8J3WHA8_PLARO|nr:hypothetical protein [Planobispora rosea]GGT09755.1 hypothetical protein GCM10010156_77950 [Planobispora rosea]GIH89300.1 hypothetical protein Pro02_77080 [Planobispora rosea]